MISMRMNDLGAVALRGRASVQANLIRLSLPEENVEALEIKMGDWLGAATASATTIETHGLDVTDNGVTANVWNMEIGGSGYANLKVTASDGRVWYVTVENVDPRRAPYADRYRYR